jgi:hypothetical protein
MNDEPPPPHTIEKSANEARQAVTTGRVRWILGVSLALGIVAMVIAYWVA